MKKIVWAEGILLGQQHLQQWDYYHHERQDFLAKLSLPFSWGIKKLILDENSLLYGTLIIKQCEAIFPNGQIIKYDSRSDIPLTYTLTPEHQNSESIYIAMPVSNHIKNITGYSSQSGVSGWTAEYQVTLDDLDMDREREVLFAHPTLVLLSSKEEKSGFYFIKIAEITKKNIGEFKSSSGFIPACFAIETSEALMIFLNSQIELLSSKAHLLQSRRQQCQSEWMDYLLLQLFNGYLQELRFLKACPQFQPVELYRVLMRLLGALNPEVPLPFYDHNNLTQVFAELDKLLKLFIEQAIPSRTSVLRWVRETEFLYTSEHIDSRVFQKNSFYLAVTMDAPVLEWLSHFTHQIKVGARSVIESIVSSALSGVTLLHVQRPPNKLVIKSGYEYFYLEPKGPFWEQIKAEQTLSLFVSHDFSRAQIELISVEEDE
jgi:type VI secretion system protein ImpJ